MEFNLENPLTNYNGELHSLFFIESEHTPSFSFSLNSFRHEALSSILQVSCSFNPFLSYLAINYLDRFLSSRGIPQQKPWMVKLLAVSCVSLAAKMMNRTTNLSLNDIQGNDNNGGGFMFDPRTIHRMETLILGALKWRMRSVTPFSFLSFFTHYFKLKDPPLLQALRARATQIILRAQNDVKMVGLKPSVIAASALLSACHELFPLQFSCFRNGILGCSYVNKEVMADSYEKMQELAMEEYESVMDRVSCSDTPVNVLDHHFFSSDDSSDEAKASAGTISSTASSSTSTGEVVIVTSESDDHREKKRKMMMMMISNGNKNKRRKISN
ncbi:Putative cyclin-D6-1 [Linum perenne]